MNLIDRKLVTIVNFKSVIWCIQLFLLKKKGFIENKDISAVMENINSNLREILELLHTTTDLDMQVKLFTVLSASVMFKNADINTIISCNYIYDKISNVLANSPPRKVTFVLNFISVILYVDEEHSRNLILYAKNMIRVSGCLATMCDLFTSSMMYQDTWRALCRSLAETCRGLEANQSYCAHLVPVCIQRCSAQNVDAVLVLICLLQNHNRNIQLFIDRNGLDLFTREFLQYETSLELLTTLVQSSSQVTTLISKTKIAEHLRDFLQLYGSHSPVLGQWSSIILYHTSRLQEFTKVVQPETDDIQNQKKSLPNENHNLELNDTSTLLQNVAKEILQWEPKLNIKDLQKFLSHHEKPVQDQKERFQTFTGAPYNNKINRSGILKQSRHIPLADDTNTFGRHKNDDSNTTFRNEHQNVHSHDLSFTFLQIQDKRKNVNYNNYSKGAMKTMDKLNYRNATTQTDSNYIMRFRNEYEGNTDIKNEHQQSIDVTKFKPKFTSTPISNDNETYIHETQHTNYINVSTVRTNLNSYKSKQPPQKIRVTNRVFKKKRNHKLNKIDKATKNRSISARVMEAVNGSCTAFVKTIKNIFVSNNKTSEIEDVSTSHSKIRASNMSCSYSFTNYMRVRDAALCNEASQLLISRIDDENMSCNSCNDTAILKRKLANNDYLKHTLKKLKVGINLYGCNFKKISRILWPRESYMTPAVLYNLYRKLLIK